MATRSTPHPPPPSPFSLPPSLSVSGFSLFAGTAASQAALALLHGWHSDLGGMAAVGLAHKGGGGGEDSDKTQKQNQSEKADDQKKKKMFVWKKLNETQAVCGRTEA